VKQDLTTLLSLVAHLGDAAADIERQDAPPPNCLRPAAHSDWWHVVPGLGPLCVAWACLPPEVRADQTPAVAPAQATADCCRATGAFHEYWALRTADGLRRCVECDAIESTTTPAGSDCQRSDCAVEEAG